MRYHRIRVAGAAAAAIFLLTIGGCGGYKPPPMPPKNAKSQPSPAQAAVAAPAPPKNLLDVRRGFQTKLLDQPRKPPEAPEPPPRVFQLVKYASPAGQLAAYVSPDPGDGRRHPAVLWAHGGFNGIGGYLWEPGTPENDQSVNAFVEAGLVVFCPSWRGENDNPGRWEMFYGEVDDLVAAIDYLARLPYVDPQRIYLAGHGTGGTLTLLGAVATDRFRAAFSFGGAADIDLVVRDGRGYGNTPYDYHSAEESKMRSAVHFVQYLQRPTFYLEGEKSVYGEDALRMERRAKEQNRPFHALIVPGANHTNILEPLTRLVAKKILQDIGPACNITLDAAEVRKAFERKP
jgi:dipeptidyl aminopeptidase/acylaminoacyl peptidase